MPIIFDEIWETHLKSLQLACQPPFENHGLETPEHRGLFGVKSTACQINRGLTPAIFSESNCQLQST
jgi:hypothetical protein